MSVCISAFTVYVCVRQATSSLTQIQPRSLLIKALRINQAWLCEYDCGCVCAKSLWIQDKRKKTKTTAQIQNCPTERWKRCHMISGCKLKLNALQITGLARSLQTQPQYVYNANPWTSQSDYCCCFEMLNYINSDTLETTSSFLLGKEVIVSDCIYPSHGNTVKEVPTQEGLIKITEYISFWSELCSVSTNPTKTNSIYKWCVF